MHKAQNQTNRDAQNYPPKRGTLTGNSLQNHVQTNVPQEDQPLSHSSIASSPYSTYTTVTLGILFFGIFTVNLQLLYLACFMASALLGPPTLKILLTFIRENFGSKPSKK